MLVFCLLERHSSGFKVYTDPGEFLHLSQLATGAVVFSQTPGKWVKVGSGDPAERIGECFPLDQDWLAVGVEQPEDKETCHGHSCPRSGDAPAKAPARHSVSTDRLQKHATVLGNPCVSPAGRQAEPEYLQNAGKRYHSVHWAVQGLKPW